MGVVVLAVVAMRHAGVTCGMAATEGKKETERKYVLQWNVVLATWIKWCMITCMHCRKAVVDTLISRMVAEVCRQYQTPDCLESK